MTSYLEVLDNERQFFTAELELAWTGRDELLAVVQLYRALGGGWAQQARPGGPRRVPAGAGRGWRA